MDVERLIQIVEHDEFIETSPFNIDFNGNLRSTDAASESFMPDGSYFGMGLRRREGLLVVDERESDVDTLNLVDVI
jgi:hypothetical protein